MKSSELNQRRQQATPRGVGVMCNYFVEKAENATLWDIEGNEVIDFAAGIAVLNTEMCIRDRPNTSSTSGSGQKNDSVSWLANQMVYSRCDRKKAPTAYITRWRGSRVRAVSYTHLDVYKRQAHWTAPQSADCLRRHF